MFGRQWSFIADINYSGSVTISDVFLWLKWLYCYPGDLCLLALMKWFPGVANFLEISALSYGETLSSVLSAIIWVIGIGIVSIISRH